MKNFLQIVNENTHDGIIALDKIAIQANLTTNQVLQLGRKYSKELKAQYDIEGFGYVKEIDENIFTK